jgi:hypothetical protein
MLKPKLRATLSIPSKAFLLGKRAAINTYPGKNSTNKWQSEGYSEGIRREKSDNKDKQNGDNIEQQEVILKLHPHSVLTPLARLEAIFIEYSITTSKVNIRCI